VYLRDEGVWVALKAAAAQVASGEADALYGRGRGRYRQTDAHFRKRLRGE